MRNEKQNRLQSDIWDQTFKIYLPGRKITRTTDIRDPTLKKRNREMTKVVFTISASIFREFFAHTFSLPVLFWFLDYCLNYNCNKICWIGLALSYNSAAKVNMLSLLTNLENKGKQINLVLSCFIGSSNFGHNQ